MDAYLKLPFFNDAKESMYLVFRIPGVKLISTPSSKIGVDNLVYINLFYNVNKYPILKKPRLRKIIRSLKNKSNNLSYITLSNDLLDYSFLDPIKLSKEEAKLLIEVLKHNVEIFSEQEFSKSSWLQKFIEYLEQQT